MAKGFYTSPDQQSLFESETHGKPEKENFQRSEQESRKQTNDTQISVTIEAENIWMVDQEQLFTKKS